MEKNPERVNEVLSGFGECGVHSGSGESSVGGGVLKVVRLKGAPRRWGREKREVRLADRTAFDYARVGV